MLILSATSPLIRPLAMTIRAQHVALRDFFEDRLRARPADHLGHNVSLGHRVTMIELHHEVRKGAAAIEAGHSSQLGEQFPLVPSVRGSSHEVARGSRCA
jgi:hypothetical protein